MPGPASNPAPGIPNGAPAAPGPGQPFVGGLPELQKGGVSSGRTDTADDAPWVVGTRLAPGQRIRRSTMWGWIALGLTVLHVLLAVIGYGTVAVNADPAVFQAVLPWWGICTLLLLAATVACFIRRGTFNIVIGVVALLTLVVSNPVLPISLIALFA